MRSLSILLLTVLTGCLQTTDELSPDALPIDRVSRPYVICFISPQDTVLAAKVAMSEPAIVRSFEPTLVVDDAVVTLSDSIRSIQLQYDSNLRYYRASPSALFPIRAGVTYQLRVQMGEGRSVTARATVPPAVPIARAAFDSTVTENTAGSRLSTYQTSIFWNSPPVPASPGGFNYYRGWGEVEQHLIDRTTGLIVERRFSQPSFSVDREISQPGALRLMTGLHAVESPPNTVVRTKRVRVGLFAIDVNYYRYQAALAEQFTNAGQSFAESTVLFSNIDGGYGVFGAYNASYLTLTGKDLRPR